MIGEAQNAKWGVLFSPQVADGAAFAANGYIDTLGWGYAEFVIQTGTLADTIGTTTASTAGRSTSPTRRWSPPARR